MPYTNNPFNNPVDRIRLMVGDISTSTSGEFLDDVQYLYLLSVAPNQYSAAALTCTVLAAKNGGNAITKKVGDLSYTKGDASYYNALKTQFTIMSALQPSGAPYAGGITISDKQNVEADANRVQPFFHREIFDDPRGHDPENRGTQRAEGSS